MKLTPITRRRLAIFRQNRRGYWSFWLFAVLFGTSLFAEFIANNRPLLIRFDGHWYVPVLQDYSEDTFGPDFLPTEADYTDPEVQQAINAHGWMIWPAVPYSFGTIVKNLPSPAPSPPTTSNPLGTDDQARDVLARVIYGTRASLLAGAISVGIALAVGVPLGLVSGYRGGFIDALISRMTDAMLACPSLILAIAFAAFLGPSLGNAMIAIGITATPIFVRLTRAQTMNVKVEDYVEAARAMGNPRWRIALFHILPNIMPALLVQATLSIATAIIAEAALSFLGLGQQPPAPSWGSMLNAAQRFLTNAPWMAIWPGLAIFLVVLSFNLVGDGLRDALDPRAR